MTYQTDIVVGPKIKEGFLSYKNYRFDPRIHTACCGLVDLGLAKIKTEFAKDESSEFFDTSKLLVTVDNTECKASVDYIEVLIR